MTIWSTFGRRWAALPSFSAALSALGVSSFIQTLLDDTDAATARTTLGAVGLTGNETVAGVKTFSSIPVLSGGAISFPAIQVASSDVNTLDDYEEGTWTPTIVGTTLAGTGTYSTQSGFYVKVGRLVYIDITLVWTAHTGTGNMVIGGLPFAPTSNTALSIEPINITLTANNVATAITQTNSTVLLRQYADSTSAISSIALDVAATIRVSGWHQVAN